jgi:1,4-alpha-glucan branching enzyme
MNAKKTLSDASDDPTQDGKTAKRAVKTAAAPDTSPTVKSELKTDAKPRKKRISTNAPSSDSNSASAPSNEEFSDESSNEVPAKDEIQFEITPLVETLVESVTASAIETLITPLLARADEQQFHGDQVSEQDGALSSDENAVPSDNGHSIFSDELFASFMHGTHTNPFALLGAHLVGDELHVRTFQPGASAVTVLDQDGMTLTQLQPIALAGAPEIHTGLFAAAVPELRSTRYVLQIEWRSTGVNAESQITLQETEDPYSFSPLLTDFELHLLREGTLRELANCLGAIETEVDGVAGVRFAVWAPNAQRVAIVGEFNQWDGRRHGMRLRHDAGVWELFVPRLAAGTRYQYQITAADGTRLPLKADPVARQTSPGASHLSVVSSNLPFVWDDDEWLDTRAQLHAVNAPISIYELHVGSWLRILEENARSLTWRELSERLIPYVQSLGFTHIQLMPIMEHPFGGSWGYQPLSQFAPTSRFGEPAAFAAFVNVCHRAGLGVILDWVPAHFPNDSHGLAHFDGSALYEHADPREGMHQDWNTLIYNFGRNEVRGFLIASALEWLEHFHIDGLRVDAVASMLYRDYSRKHGEWVPNIYGGRENLEAVGFINLKTAVKSQNSPRGQS